ncbi:MAG: alpha/beta hydrolase, partial [Solirubrobacteraceae bacterium]|nr:alpha/beta hydrolase [Solirubrobacteraceae bacterium]
TLAARYPEQVRSLVSIMSSTGSSRTGLPARSTWIRMVRPPGRSREQAVGRMVALFRHIGSHGFPFDETEVRALAGASYDRDHSPAGVRRQLAAIMKSGSRTHEVRKITAPTLVIHGDRDLMVDPSGGAATHAAIGGSRLETIAGMGHDLPAGVRPRLATLIVDHVRAADAARDEATSSSNSSSADAAPTEAAGA